MLINTRDLGEVEIDEDKIITFPVGIPAFDDLRSFVILSPLGEGEFPKWLQSTEEPALCFIVFDPATMIKDYKLVLEDNEQKILQITKESTDVAALAIATVGKDVKDTVVNLKSPVIINAEKRLGMQIILQEDYPFRAPLFPGENKNAKPETKGGAKKTGGDA